MSESLRAELLSAGYQAGRVLNILRKNSTTLFFRLHLQFYIIFVIIILPVIIMLQKLIYKTLF